MTHVITQVCVSDASCVPVCPVNAIHPAPGEPGFGTAEMLYIDPIACIDCGACLRACPVLAIRRHDDPRPDTPLFLELNAAAFINGSKPKPQDGERGWDA